jgi:hypothetical protein
MPTLEDLKTRVKDLLTLIEGKSPGKGKGKAPKQDLSIPGSEIGRFINEVERTLEGLKRYVIAHPTKGDCADAVKHPLGNQIVVFTTRDKKRKAFFSPTYFKSKLNALPCDQEEFLAAAGKKTTAYRDALILAYWWNSRHDDHKAMKVLWREIESDYKNSPEALRESAADGLLQDLMGLEDVSEAAHRLAAQYPSDTELKEFARLVSLKIPAQPRGRGVPKLTPHERLARAIHSLGGVARLQLD